ncbi:uncharacterized protein PADG_06554 [Paracoccidioides brasiliensis Pb18]|uniref:Kelch repeat protein n=1 Tax=Paracoccidioides brasiliensis (strain Pb18) TaxID=502780 RepID=C1GH18_PARBD|nr:uncharacterized protein PADG_06554 [Paracoccidioides brasiliensis Pb18]EEH50475.1 hypothetical protein PADG_06554 [Paracoccidioides brasiliensis Pb18]
MALFFVAAVSILLGLPKGVDSQTFQNQVNYSICAWYHFRANLIRDKIYLDGGVSWGRRGLTDGTYGAPDAAPDPRGQTFLLNLTTPFDTANTNLTGLFDRLPTTSNFAPPVIHGTMLANDNKFYLYGGLPKLSDFLSPPDKGRILSYERDQYGPPATSWTPGFLFEDLKNITPFVSNGAGISVPSENKAFYFSGIRGTNWGEIGTTGPPPNVTANSLITVDMSIMRAPIWENSTLLDGIPGRVNAELVWIPVSVSGLLIAVGGVIYPVDVLHGLTESQQQENNRTAPGFMRSVPVYDIDTQKWYMQDTTGDYPPQLSHFCSVVAAAQDGSSYNIYIYGGYSGNSRLDIPIDDVYILSVPSFTWIHAYDGKRKRGRYGHKCIKPHPDKMFVLGGRDDLSPTACLDPIRVFNLNTLKFQNTYHPSELREYEIPDLVTAKIGGNAKGGASTVEPSSWADNSLRDLFRTKYTKSIKTYYPYPVQNASGPNPAPSPENYGHGGGNGLPKWVAPVLGAVLGLIFVTCLAVLWLLWRRRRDRTYATSEGATSDNRKRIMGWMYGIGFPTQKTNMTTASTEIGINDKHTSASGISEAGDLFISSHRQSGVVHSDPNAQEAGGVQVHEMHAGHVFEPLELPTEYNVAPASYHTQEGSDTPTFTSPVSPESPSPHPNPTYSPSQPIHGRNHSSLSSTGFNLSLSNAMNTEERSSPRRGYVSGFTEDLPSPESEP